MPVKFQKYYSIFLILLIAPFAYLGQKADSLTLKDLKKVNCESVSEKSSKKKQIQCLIIDAVRDGINYYPSKVRISQTPIVSSDLAWETIQKLYPEHKPKEFKCWSEYHGYYVFSLDCGMAKKNIKCSFLSIIYVPVGGFEFWYFVPHT